MSEAHKPDREAIVQAMMELCAQKEWREIEIADIARKAGVGLSGFRREFPSKGAVLAAFSRMIDLKVLEGEAETSADEPARERLFDVLMRRFDALAPYKDALRNIARGLRFDPLALASLNRVALNSQRFMLAAAGVSTEGPLGAVKMQGAALAFANAMRVWLEDDDPAFARTMARLDRELRRGETLLEQAETASRLFEPCRAFGRAFMGRRGERARTGSEPETGETSNPAAAI